MRNHEVTKEHKLLDENGQLIEPGWSRRLIQEYNREMIKAPKWRIKEWDYYLVTGKDFAAAFTISDDGYIGLQSVSLLELGDEPWEHTETILNALPLGRIGLPCTSSDCVTKYSDRRLKLRFDARKGKRRIRCRFEDFCDGKPFECDIVLRQPEMDSMVIATPWDTKHAFYYNQKINAMRAEGEISYNGKIYRFDPATDFGTLDWGRGVWTYDNCWLWGTGNADIDGHAFGFNLGYGFGNTSAATENIIIYDGKAHKLDDVTFNIPDDLMEKWTITSSDGRFEAELVPVLDRAACIDFKLLISDQHHVFGRLTGKAVLDDGTVIEMKDIMCAVEKVHNRY
ncbi:MAG: DUF2804 domain-containing protein [Lachnospiraceae bacterium]|nr:DUF2804 domain-containing protein [Lachnospiraceae bacterium]